MLEILECFSCRFANSFFLVVFLLAWQMSGKSKYKMIDYLVLNNREMHSEIKKWLAYNENVKE